MEIFQNLDSYETFARGQIAHDQSLDTSEDGGVEVKGKRGNTTAVDPSILNNSTDVSAAMVTIQGIISLVDCVEPSLHRALFQTRTLLLF